MTTQSRIKGLMFAAAVVIASAACGTGGSPTGMDVSAIEASAGFSALRSEPTPPQAPEPQSPESVPLAGDPGPVPEADTKPLDPKDDVESVPVPSNRPNRPLPGTVPNDSPGPDPVPENEGPDTVPEVGSDTVPTPAPTGPTPSTVPPPPQEPTPSPLPPADEPTGTCAAVSMDVVFEGTFLGFPAGDRFKATLLDKAGIAITDASCDTLVWEVEGESSGSTALTVTPSGTRYATVNGEGRVYKIGATVPNGVSGSMVMGGGAR